MAPSFLKPGRRERKSLNKGRRPEGMTLLECVVAMAVAALALSGVLSALALFGAYQVETGLAVRAALCAEEKMEELRYEIETGNAESQDARVVLLEGPYQGMERLWTVVPAPGEPGLWRLESECAYYWRGERKAERIVSLAVERGG